MPSLNLQLMLESLPFILQGLPYTLALSVLSFLLGNLTGVLLTILSLLPSRLLRWGIRLYISFLRGVPALVLLFILYFGVPYRLSATTAVVLCLTLTSSAFLAEIYRGAIGGVHSGQWDAARALGFPFVQIMTKIILPQAFRIAIPSLGNVAMDLVKGTALAATITVPEIFQKAKIIGGREFDYMSLYVLVAIIYWLLCVVIGQVQQSLEKRYQQY